MQLFLYSYDMTLSYCNASGSKAHTTATQKAAGREVAGSPERMHPADAQCREDSDSQLRAVQCGSFLYQLIYLLLGPAAIAWGFGWFDDLDGHLQVIWVEGWEFLLSLGC